MPDTLCVAELPTLGANDEDVRALTDWLADETADASVGPPASQPRAFPSFANGLLPPATANSRLWGAPAALADPVATAAHRGSGSTCSLSAAAARPDTPHASGDSAPAVRGGRSNTTSVDSEEKRRVREKNKYAQKRYREKQRDRMAEMESRTEVLREQLGRVGAESAALQRRNQVLSKLVELKQTHIATLTEVVKANELRLRDGADETQAGVATGAAAAAVLSPVTIEECRRMQHSDMVARWRAYAERMASLLIEAEMPNPTQGCLDRLHQVSAETWSFAQTISLSQPLALKTLLVSNLQTGRWGEPREDDELDQGQQEQLLYVGSMFMLFMADTDKLRKEISEHVLTVLPQSCGNRRYASIIQIAETMITVQQKFTRADQEAVTFSSITFSEILTPLQFARFTTQAYPLFPNPLQIIKVLAAEMSEQDRERLASATHGIDVAAIHDFAEHMCKCVAA